MDPQAPCWTKRVRVGKHPPEMMPCPGRIGALEQTRSLRFFTITIHGSMVLVSDMARVDNTVRPPSQQGAYFSPVECGHGYERPGGEQKRSEQCGACCGSGDVSFSWYQLGVIRKDSGDAESV